MKLPHHIRFKTGLLIALLLALLASVPRVIVFEMQGVSIAVLFFFNTFIFTVLLWISIFRFFRYSPNYEINGSPFARWKVLSVSLVTGVLIMIPIAIPTAWVAEYLEPLPLRFPYAGRLSMGKAVIVTLFVITFKYIFDLQEERNRVSVENERLKAENLRSELEILKQQINPHFLFNVLSSLKSVIKNDPEDAKEFVVRLAKLYRYILETRKEDLISLRKEWELLNHYIFMLKARFEENLIIKVEMPESELSGQIPPLSLIVLLENCVKHNIISYEQPLYISIYKDNHQYFVVSNSLQPRHLLTSHGTGLQNLKKRFTFFTNREIIIEKTQSTFTVKLPLIK